MITFASSAVHKFNDLSRTAYEGPRTPQTDQAWDRAAEWAGWVGLDGAEYAHLQEETIAHPEMPNKHIVLVGVFHQLHCLVCQPWVYVCMRSESTRLNSSHPLKSRMPSSA